MVIVVPFSETRIFEGATVASFNAVRSALATPPPAAADPVVGARALAGGVGREPKVGGGDEPGTVEVDLTPVSGETHRAGFGHHLTGCLRHRLVAQPSG